MTILTYLEKLNNGFDSIVVNLNENFKSVIKSISTIDQTERLDKFSIIFLFSF